MLVLSRKRILFVSLIIVTSTFLILNLPMGTPLPGEPSLLAGVSPLAETSSTPVSNHTIILDAGHGLPDGGAVGIDGSYESDINLEIVLKLQNLLEASGCTVILTRSDEFGIYETDKKSIRQKKISDMKNRAQIGNNTGSEIFVSIHMNKISDSRYYGWQTFYKKDDENSKNIAKLVQENLNYYIQKENKREINSISRVYLAKNVAIPLIIVECGFLSNAEETRLLHTDEYQNQLAWGIFCGLMDYFNN